MSRKTLLIVIAITAIILLGFGVLYLYRDTPFVQNIGLFPGEGLVVTPGVRPGDDEDVNIPITVPDGGEEDGTPARLYELHKTPVSGVGFMETGLPVAVVTTAKTSKSKTKTPPPSPEPHTVTARYIERGLGHIYETPLDASFIETRIVNETRPRIAEAFFGNNGKSVAVRYLDSEYGTEIIKTRILNLLATSTSSPFMLTEEVILPDSIPFMAVAEDGTDKFFYLTSGLSSSAGSLMTSKGASTGIFNSSFTEWLPQFPSQSLVAISSRPSSDVLGSLFFIDTKTKALSKVLDGLKGLTSKVSRDGKRVLYSTTQEGRPELFVYDVAKKESSGLFLQTLPEKCAWSAKETAVVYCAVPQTMDAALYPDQWYRGTISFSDRVWKINTVATSTALMEKVFSPEEYRAPEMDIVNPVLSSDDSYLLFMNKLSGTPWVYRITDTVPAPTTMPATSPTVSTPSPTGETPTATTAPDPNPTDGMTKIK